mmetsp:Transcript_19114/g.49063  ORF Transcript_19114/g.49063 Transcript_19114/m.49063 type:complete len:488 (-) Transcript_19114:183-1646(-)
MSPRDFDGFTAPLAAAAVGGQETGSARALDGLERSLPGWQPRPATLVASSGLIRAQQLVVMQNLRIPCMPSIVGSDGGLVLDRVLGSVGMRSWWATVSGRWRAQQAVSGWRAAGASASSLGRLAKLDNFALCGQLRWQPLRRASVTVVATAPSLHALPRVPASKAPAAEGQPPAEDPTLRAGLRLHGAGHRLDALAAFNNDFGGWAGSPPQRVASLFSVEAGSQPQYRVRGHSLHYHAGLIRQQVSAGEDAKVDARAAAAWDVRGSWRLGRRKRDKAAPVQTGSMLERVYGVNRDGTPAPEPETPARKAAPFSAFVSGARIKAASSLGVAACMPLGRPTERTAVQPFFSASLYGRAGRFTRALLDHTELGARLDLGLNPGALAAGREEPSSETPGAPAPGILPLAAGPRGEGLQRSLTCSVAQQVIGPLRARADLQFSPAADEAGKRVDMTAVYGADVMVPGLRGAARLAAWYSPSRKEGMMEMRMF